MIPTKLNWTEARWFSSRSWLCRNHLLTHVYQPDCLTSGGWPGYHTVALSAECWNVSPSVCRPNLGQRNLFMVYMKALLIPEYRLPSCNIRYLFGVETWPDVKYRTAPCKLHVGGVHRGDTQYCVNGNYKTRIHLSPVASFSGIFPTEA